MKHFRSLTALAGILALVLFSFACASHGAAESLSAPPAISAEAQPEVSPVPESGLGLLGAIGLIFVIGTVAAAAIDTPEREGAFVVMPVAAATTLYAGTLIARDGSGNAVAASATAGLTVVGRAENDVNNSAGAAGDLTIVVKRGVFRFANSGTAAVDADDEGKWCYVEDNTTVCETATLRVPAGRVVDVDADGVWIDTRDNASFTRVINTLVSATGITLTPAQSGAVISNLGAAAAAVYALPPATPGLNFSFLVEVAQELRIDPDGTETVAAPATGVQAAAGKYIGADAIGERVSLVCVTAGTWDVLDYVGTWTAEA
jgi:hypothetical protein